MLKQYNVLFSKGLYDQFIKNKQIFVKKYDTFLSTTSTKNIAEVAKIIDIDVHSIDF